MQIVKGFYDNGTVSLVEKVTRYKGEIVIIFPARIENESENNRMAFLGCMKGQGWVSDDFNEPITVMEDYM